MYASIKYNSQAEILDPRDLTIDINLLSVKKFAQHHQSHQCIISRIIICLDSTLTTPKERNNKTIVNSKLKIAINNLTTITIDALQIIETHLRYCADEV